MKESLVALMLTVFFGVVVPYIVVVEIIPHYVGR